VDSHNARTLRLLSYNIQAGVDTQHYRQYVTQSWKHVLPHKERLLNLNRIAALLQNFDVVGLQEVDSGSLRSGFVDQTEYLAHRGGFPHWYKQINRNMGRLAQHSNGVLCRHRPNEVGEHRLPGLPGRGVMVCRFGELAVGIVHLALGRRARMRQVDFVGELMEGIPHVVIMGDLNCSCDSPEMQRLMQRLELQEPVCDKSTFPSWRPMRRLDHILVSESLQVSNARVLDYPFSDHLPIGIDVLLPDGVGVAA
jgi:endonuclease/exonuclease/phosphatase family metal-dependent hydrolase